MADVNKSPSQSRLLLISVPRTASNLMLKILNIPGQKLVTNEKGGYFFFNAFLKVSFNGRLTLPVEEWSEAQKQEIRDAFQEAVDGLEDCAQRAEQEGKIAFAKEHAFWLTNPAELGNWADHAASFRPRISDKYGPSQTFSPLNHTVLPDEYLHTWRLTFIIRHPALAFPSLCRALQKFGQSGLSQREDGAGSIETNLTLKWTRMLYDWCLEQPDLPGKPLVVDAQDIIHNPQVMVRYCEETGLDPNALQFEWESKQEVPDRQTLGPDSQSQKKSDVDFDKAEAEAVMLLTLSRSTGIIKDKTPTAVDITAEVKQWKEEFGEELASILETTVRDAMPDYEYLRSRRITV
ncbi:hypothetical protein Asppvi_003886 [Aspergillus pseudoviridinutans]|uniref:P-loop containing nucleoside triphosphate hydrolase protein n=1 Tax=Aspergillus pseudoviridinutans TaxID=1517512 RepID=A0A9P3ER82_9EURO|nr:uncharacterized protein Asppvi_003886 [Aspergillus pseudoviridinutans]GIJ85031.1 hypothetical protein Asppvi_003886 [Aspergillus pseudoviridinutans]